MAYSAEIIHRLFALQRMELHLATRGADNPPSLFLPAAEAIEKSRAELLTSLPTELADAYEKAKSVSAAPWVTRLEGKMCPQCRLLLPSTLVHELLQLVHALDCPRCHRLLILGGAP